jgi:hypothetical protein
MNSIKMYYRVVTFSSHHENASRNSKTQSYMTIIITSSHKLSILVSFWEQASRGKNIALFKVRHSYLLLSLELIFCLIFNSFFGGNVLEFF